MIRDVASPGILKYPTDDSHDPRGTGGRGDLLWLDASRGPGGPIDASALAFVRHCSVFKEPVSGRDGPRGGDPAGPGPALLPPEGVSVPSRFRGVFRAEARAHSGSGTEDSRDGAPASQLGIGIFRGGHDRGSDRYAGGRE